MIYLPNDVIKYERENVLEEIETLILERAKKEGYKSIQFFAVNEALMFELIYRSVNAEEKAEKAYKEARKAHERAEKAYEEAKKAREKAEKAYEEAKKAHEEAKRAREEIKEISEKLDKLLNYFASK